MADFVSINELANLALDKIYRQTAGPVLKQIYAISNAPSSPLQQALRELDEEAQRLEAIGAPLLPDNAVLSKALGILEKTYDATAMLIQAADNKVEAGGRGVAVPALTAKVFNSLSQDQIQRGIDPLSPQALNFYLSTLKDHNIPWRLG
jgi:hypothetical protein